MEYLSVICKADFNTPKTNPYGTNIASFMILRLDLRGERPDVV